MPSQAKKITFDTAALFTAKVLSLLLGIVRLKYIAIYLGVSTFGIYTFATYFVAMFGILFDLGISQIMTRDIAADRSRSRDYVFNGLLLKLLLFILTSLIITVVIVMSHFDKITNQAIVFSVFITGINSFTLIFTSTFQAHRRMKLVSLITVATDLTTSVAIIFLLLRGYGLPGLLMGSTVASLTIFLSALIVCQKICGGVRTEPNPKLWRYLVVEGYPAALGSLGFVLYMYLTSSLLKYLRGDEIAGFYNAAFKIITILTIVPVSFTPVIYPFFAELHHSDKNKLKAVLTSSVRYMLIISIPLCFGTILVAKKIIISLYTQAFLPAAIPLQILIVSSMFGYPNYVLYTFLPAIGKQRFTMFVTIPFGVIIAVLNYILIPIYGYLVPSISLAVVEIMVFLSAFLYLRRIGISLNLLNLFYKPVTASVLMALPVYMLSAYNIFFQIGTGIIVYFVAFYLLRGIMPEDKLILYKIIPSPIRELMIKNL
ncbi:MAG: flippase [Candidatus Kryptoniota bacterium]